MVKRILRYIFILGFIAGIAASIFFGLVYFGAFGKVPSLTALSRIQNPEASTVVDGQGRVLGKFFVQNRTSVPIASISQNAIGALIATEDARFYQHHGIDYVALGRVLFKTFLLSDNRSGGGSTLTQQLAKNVFGRQHLKSSSLAVVKTWEMIVASRLETLLSKEEILELYLNTVPFGEGVYGIETASKRFFNVRAKDLSLAQAATLIGMLKANTWYNPRLYPEKSRWRRNVVLSQMKKSGVIADDICTETQELPLGTDYHPVDLEHGDAPYFIAQVRKEVERIIESMPEEEQPNLYTDGLTIKTTLNSDLQKHAEAAMLKSMQALQSKFDAHWPGQKLWMKHPEIVEAALKTDPTYNELIRNGLSHDKAIASMKESAPEAIFSYDSKHTQAANSYEALLTSLKQLKSGLVAIEPESGKILTWVGGVDFNHFPFDAVNPSTKRQVGSTIKPLLYATALEMGKTPCDEIATAAKTYELNDQTWTPTNSGSDSLPNKIPIKQALAHSVNTVAVSLLDEIGIDELVKTAPRAGITTPLPEVLSLALGTAEIPMLEMTEAYACLANEGQHLRSYMIEQVVDRKGKTIYTHAAKRPSTAFKKSTARLVIEMMKGVVNQGTAKRLRTQYQLTQDIAGKTGTTQDNTDGWFIGVTPNLVCATWVGGSYRPIRFRSTGLGQGAATALPIYAEFMKLAQNDPLTKELVNGHFRPLKDSENEDFNCESSGHRIKILDWFQKRKEQKEQDSTPKKSTWEKLRGVFRRK